MKHKKTSIALASAAILAVGTQFAGATPTMRLTSGATVITVTDETVGDGLNGTPGAVLYSGAVGAWFLTVDTGVTKPLSGSPTSPYMDVSFQGTSMAAGSLTIEFSEIGFGPMNPADNFTISIGGTSGGTVTCTTLLDVNNVLFAGNQLATQTWGVGAYGCSAFAPGVQTNPFSLTKVITINHGNGTGLTSSGNTEIKVPDGGTTLALLGCSMLGLGAARRKFGKG